MIDKIELSNDQAEAMKKINNWIKTDDGMKRSLELSLGGYAGTGKTTLIRELVRQPIDSMVMSLTGKAVSVLRKKGVSAETIHSTIYYVREHPDRTVSFYLKENIDAELFIIDEASMVSEQLYVDLNSFGIPTLWVGDHGQLEPIGANPGLMSKPDIRLERIHRQAAGNPIIRFAEKLRNGHRPTIEDEGPIPIIKKEALTQKMLVRSDQIICAMNTTRVKINCYVRELISDNYTTDPVVGDRVICLKNSRPDGIFNGLQGVVVSITKQSKLTYRVVIELDGGREYEGKIYRDQFNHERGLIDVPKGQRATHWDYSYAITCHKAQGSEWDSVVVVEQPCRLWSSARWAYTAATRASKDLIYAVQ